MSGTLHDDMSKFEPEVHAPQVEREESKGDSNPNDRDTLIIDSPQVIPDYVPEPTIEAEPVE
jgi:hypothetical protein